MSSEFRILVIFAAAALNNAVYSATPSKPAEDDVEGEEIGEADKALLENDGDLMDDEAEKQRLAALAEADERRKAQEELQHQLAEGKEAADKAAKVLVKEDHDLLEEAAEEEDDEEAAQEREEMEELVEADEAAAAEANAQAGAAAHDRAAEELEEHDADLMDEGDDDDDE